MHNKASRPATPKGADAERDAFVEERLSRISRPEDANEDLIASIQHSPLPMVVTDCRLADNPIVGINAAFTALTGYSKAEVLGRNCRFLAGPATDPAGSRLLGDAVRSGTRAFAELVNYRRDGSQFRNAVMIAPVLDDCGAVTHFLGSQMEVGSGALVSETGRREAAMAAIAPLTLRQRQVLQAMAAGYRNKQIARHLMISEKTVKMHRASLIAKLGVATSADAVRLAVEAGL